MEICLQDARGNRIEAFLVSTGLTLTGFFCCFFFWNMPGRVSPLQWGWGLALTWSFQAPASALAYHKLLGTHQHLKLGPCPGHSHHSLLHCPDLPRLCAKNPPVSGTLTATVTCACVPLPCPPSSFWITPAHVPFACWPLLFPIEINTFRNDHIRCPAHFLLSR